MSHLKDFKIENFRGFDTLQIEGLSRVNLFVGKNNCGKTSVLEALFLLLGMSNPMLPETINSLRGIGLTSPQQLKYLFHKLKFINEPTFYGLFDDTTERWLKISPKYQKRIEQNNSIQKGLSIDSSTLSATTATPEINGVEMSFSIKRKHEQKKNFTSSLILNLPQINPVTSKDYTENILGVYLTSNNNDNSALGYYSEIVKKRNEGIIIDALKLFDDRIESIHPLPEGIFFGLKGMDELVPSKILGDGMRKFLSIITAIAQSKNLVILLDEIENGLHYKAHKLLWEKILSMTNAFNSQIFITTHNIETLSCLKTVLEQSDYNKMQNLVKVYTLAETSKSGFKTYRYSFEAFKDAIEKETELRG